MSSTCAFRQTCGHLVAVVVEVVEGVQVVLTPASTVRCAA